MNIKTSAVKHLNEDIPYSPSYIDRFMYFMKSRRTPYWLIYLGLMLLEILISQVIFWVDGWLPRYTFSPFSTLYPVWRWLPLLIMTYVNSVAADSLAELRPLLKMEDKEFNKLEYEFANMPPRAVFLSGLFWGIDYIFVIYIWAFPVLFNELGIQTNTKVIVTIIGFITFLTTSVLYYHSIRLLGLINRVVRSIRHLNLFRLEPVYAFSRVTSLVGISWMFMLTLSLLAFPAQTFTGSMIPILIVQLVFALAAFVLPLWFVHRRLEAEKLGLIAELNLRVEATIEMLHADIDNKNLKDSGDYGTTLNTLKTEREILNKIPTWPWHTETLAGFLSATVLPLAIFVLQLVIQRFVGQ